jgi:NAD(P)-dependent dehydrogenase (short-subunit alcohol dehydrogenase family)
MTVEYNFSGKTYLITGASSGIGKFSAKFLSERGARVYITGRNEERLNNTYKELSGNEHQMEVCDLSVEEEVANLVSNIESIDGLVFSAGVTSHLPVKFIREKNISEVFGINVQAPILLTSFLLTRKKINKDSSLVYLSSLASKYPYFGGALYGSSKMALEGYVKYLSFELAPKKIRANCLLPSYVKTEMIDSSASVISKENMEKHSAQTPMGMGEPLDVANAIAYLLSVQSKWVSGSALTLGGF